MKFIKTLIINISVISIILMSCPQSKYFSSCISFDEHFTGNLDVHLVGTATEDTGFDNTDHYSDVAISIDPLELHSAATNQCSNTVVTDRHFAFTDCIVSFDSSVDH